MQRPPSVTAASWIWMCTALFATFTVANILTATEILVVFTDLAPTMSDVSSVEAISWFGWLLAAIVLVGMVIQVAAAVRFREGADWARTVLSVFTFFSLLGVLADFTILSAWVLLAANVTAMVLAYGQPATTYLEQRYRALVRA